MGFGCFWAPGGVTSVASLRLASALALYISRTCSAEASEKQLGSSFHVESFPEWMLFLVRFPLFNWLSKSILVPGTWKVSHLSFWLAPYGGSMQTKKVPNAIWMSWQWWLHKKWLGHKWYVREYIVCWTLIHPRPLPTAFCGVKTTWRRQSGWWFEALPKPLVGWIRHSPKGAKKVDCIKRTHWKPQP